jgi:hypothetical protein
MLIKIFRSNGQLYFGTSEYWYRKEKGYATATVCNGKANLKNGRNPTGWGEGRKLQGKRSSQP